MNCRYPRVIVLGDHANLLAPYPKRAGKVTVLKLNSPAKITKISYWSPGAEKLDSVLKQTPWNSVGRRSRRC